jgi:hypothetical protein
MPASRYPTLADGTLMRTRKARWASPRFRASRHLKGCSIRSSHDLGPQFRYNDQSGVVSEPPCRHGHAAAAGRAGDADGNEVGGIRSPLLMAPLAPTQAGMSRHPAYYKGNLCMGGSPIGGFIPFAKTRAERMASGDRDRRSRAVQGSRRALHAVRTAADKLVHEGFCCATMPRRWWRSESRR